MLPSGCNKDVLLKDLIIGWPDCRNLTNAQQSIIAYLRDNGFDLLRVSAPSWRPYRGKVDHHAETNSIDFTADAPNLSELFRAWEFLRRTFPGTVLLGVNEPSKGYTADLHLHVSGTWSERLYRHGFETQKNGQGIVTNNDRAFRQVYTVAAQVYGWRGQYQEVKPKSKNDLGFTVTGLAVGAGIGFPAQSQVMDWARFAAYVAAGGSIGFIADQFLGWLQRKAEFLK